jgi:hypothetical protein
MEKGRSINLTIVFEQTDHQTFVGYVSELPNLISVEADDLDEVKYLLCSLVSDVIMDLPDLKEVNVIVKFQFRLPAQANV